MTQHIDLQNIRARHESCRPNPVENPAWAYAEQDIGTLLIEIDRLRSTGERGCFVLMEMMKAYERRIRTDCRNQEELEKRPWECAEYLAAASYLRTVWPAGAHTGSQQ